MVLIFLRLKKQQTGSEIDFQKEIITMKILKQNLKNKQLNGNFDFFSIKSIETFIRAEHLGLKESLKIIFFCFHYNCYKFLFRTNRAVRCILERGDDMLISGGRHPVLGKYKVQQHTLVFISAES